MKQDAPSFDLQSHSVHSDGSMTPTEVVATAARSGVKLMALSDHDSVDGVDDALAAGERLGVCVVRCAEITSVHELHEDLHILGYCVDHRDAAFKRELEAFRADRERRAEGMAERLRALGYAVDSTLLEQRRRAGKTIGRPHLAMSVINHPANAGRLEAEGLGDVTPFIREYLISGRPAFLARTRPTVDEAIAVIHAAGGVAIWAHPFWDLDNPDEVLGAIDLFRASGLDGVEAFYATHSEQQTHLLADRCEREGLLTTGSADFHGPDHRLFSRFRAFELYGREPILGPIGGG